jgi:hypothetical protein
LQSTLLDIATDADTSIAFTADNLAQHIQGKIGKLKSDFKRATGIDSFVEPPNKFAELFQAFLVSTFSEDDKIPLILRGDGIQARFVSSVLHHICESSNKFFIWGFEEPENSLEYSHVINLVKDFLTIYSKKAQIFITTHSPAFTSIQTKENTSYRVYREDNQSIVSQVWPFIKDSEELAKLNIEMGFLKIQENLHKEYVSQREELIKIREQLTKIESDIKNYEKPLLLTEGKTDKKILEIAWSKCKGSVDPPFIIREADPSLGIKGGAGGAQTLSKMIESIHPEENRKAIAIFDRDLEGIKCFNNLSSNFKVWNNNQDIKAHINGLAFAIILPVPVGREDHGNNQNLCLEHYFDDNTLMYKTINNKGLLFSKPKIDGVMVDGKLVKHSIPQRLLPNIKIFSKIRGGKEIFASEIVPYLHKTIFINFNTLFLNLENILA